MSDFACCTLNKGGGSGTYCCIRQCKSSFYDFEKKKSGIGFFKIPKKSSFYDFQKKKSGIGFFKIPKNTARRNKWAKIISQFRRKGGNDNFVIKDTTLVCELHFKNEDIQFLYNIGRKSLKKEAFPSIFEFKKQVDVQKRCSPKKRKFIENFDIKNVSRNEDNFKTNDRELLIDFEVEKVCLCCVELQNKIDLLEKEKHELKSQISILESKNKKIKNQLNQYKRKNGENVKNHNSGLSENLYSVAKNGFTILHTSWLFKISKSTTSRYLITWTNFLYFSLGSVPIWPSREQVYKFMPESFKMTFPSTRCIIDCTELFCQKPSSLRHQSSLFSSYKHHVTYKGLLGISPSGARTFISQLYDGAISDKEIVVRSRSRQRLKGGQLQLSKEDATESQTIASLRIHVERAIRRIKVFR
ncbi:uncharacterized protein LOC136085444 [Hydra vulgaris]|uniref:Uncharacterized protein LOC136085444 n=1 Tax=Hydra vulgaris TaxID=6087 RepID=A0ABM4CM02_HYDVU